MAKIEHLGESPSKHQKQNEPIHICPAGSLMALKLEIEMLQDELIQLLSLEARYKHTFQIHMTALQRMSVDATTSIQFFEGIVLASKNLKWLFFKPKTNFEIKKILVSLITIRNLLSPIVLEEDEFKNKFSDLESDIEALDIEDLDEGNKLKEEIKSIKHITTDKILFLKTDINKLLDSLEEQKIVYQHIVDIIQEFIDLFLENTFTKDDIKRLTKFALNMPRIILESRGRLDLFSNKDLRTWVKDLKHPKNQI